ncbi:MAG: ABC transporter ATP-binding protein [SAR324 cluster bacterium]|nr:ABC transporter ATP-binding protein [SAR324 cluster bacterium]
MAQMQPQQPILKVRNLKTHFFTGEGVVKAVDGVEFEVHKGETLGIVGESGCGKSVTALSILRLIATPPGRIVDGTVDFLGQDLLKLSNKEIRQIRGEQISMIFQDPLASLNPVLRVGYQLAEVFRYHLRMKRPQALAESVKALRATEIPSPAERLRNYPHEMSGGMRQRAMIAMALACQPALLIADEPTTALDVTVQAQVLKLVKEICRSRDTAVILITHDMGVIANMCQRVAVMYAGRVVEYTDVFSLFDHPAHPYTRDLLRSLPRLGAKASRLDSIEGQPPRLNNLPPGCSYAPRCKSVAARCLEEAPPAETMGPGHEVRCFFPFTAKSKKAGQARKGK